MCTYYMNLINTAVAPDFLSTYYSSNYSSLNTCSVFCLSNDQNLNTLSLSGDLSNKYTNATNLYKNTHFIKNEKELIHYIL